MADDRVAAPRFDAAFINALRADVDLYRVPLPVPPPGLTGEDLPLYTAFVERPPFRVSLAFFNVRVGPQVADLRGLSGIDAQLVAQLLAPRVDMLASDGRTWWLVEFHGQAGLSQLGRLVAYPELLRDTYPEAPPVRSVMIAQRPNPFALAAFTRRGIPVFVYDTPTSPPRAVNVVGA